MAKTISSVEQSVAQNGFSFSTPRAESAAGRQRVHRSSHWLRLACLYTGYRWASYI